MKEVILTEVILNLGLPHGLGSLDISDLEWAGHQCLHTLQTISPSLLGMYPSGSTSWYVPRSPVALVALTSCQVTSLGSVGTRDGVGAVRHGQVFVSASSGWPTVSFH